MNEVVQNNWWSVERKRVKKDIFDKLNQKSPFQTTDIEKIIINSGVGSASTNQNLLLNTADAITKIAQGQKVIFNKAKKSIIEFKLRKGTLIGCKVTLRKEKAWNFLFELININLPAINNFQGFSKKKFDKSGKNYNIGLNDLNIFPAVPFDKTFKNQGIQITFVFKSNSLKENILFLQHFKFPFNEK